MPDRNLIIVERLSRIILYGVLVAAVVFGTTFVALLALTI